MNELLKLYEDIINELEDTTIKSLETKRGANKDKAWADFVETRKTGTPEQIAAASDKDTKEARKFYRLQDMLTRRARRKLGEQRRNKEFKERLIDKEQTPKEYKDADTEHGNAQLNQYLRNKLEKMFKKRSKKNPFDLKECLEQILVEANVTSICIEDILQRIGDFLFEKSQEDNIIDFNTEKRKNEIAKEVKQMMASGETDKVRQTNNGTVIGDTATVARLNALKAELNRLNSKKKKD